MDQMKHAFVALVLAALIPSSLFAAELRTVAESASVVAAEEFTIYVELYPDEPINAVEGTVTLPPGMRFVRVVTTGALNMWPHYPSYSAATRTLTFVGGTASPITGPALLFQIIAEADQGTYALTAGATSYLSDGKGTQGALDVTTEPVVVGTEAGAHRDPVSTATLTPLTAEIAQNVDVYEGKWFVTLSGGDKGQGILYYEIQEGDLPAAQAGSVYVLQDQSRASTVVVSAVYPDNSRTSITLTPPSDTQFWLWAVLAAIAILVAALILRRRKNK